MSTLFFSSNRDISVGSYRIWVNDLSQYFNELGIPAKIYTDNSDFQDCDTIIVGKSDALITPTLRQSFPNKKIGVINLQADRLDLPIDFVIVGSVEEKASLSTYDNVFIYPLIERLYQNKQLKTHTNSDILKIGFHGNYPHLAKFEPHLSRALEEINKQHKIELVIVTSSENYDWQYGRPNIENITMKTWDINTVGNDISEFDIGIVPNITDIPLDVDKHGTSVDHGLYNTDYIFRMKNKSNAGRAFVFHQLGIPVIADFTPSNFHIMGDPDCGYLVHDQDSWKRAVIELMDPSRRQSVAKKARKEFDRLYNPYKWAERLNKQIGEIK